MFARISTALPDKGVLEFEIEALLALLAIVVTLLICAVVTGLAGRKPSLPEDLAGADRQAAQLRSSVATFRRYFLAAVIGLASGLAIVWYRVLGNVVWEMVLVACICLLVWSAFHVPRLRRWIWLIPVIALMGAWTASYVRWPAASPQRVAREFLTKVNHGDCEAAWQYFSTDAQRAIEAEAERRQSQNYLKGWHDELWSAHNLYCKPNGVNPYRDYDPRSVAVLTQTATRARIGVKQGEASGFLIPGFFPTKTIWHDRQMELVREGRDWKLDRPNPTGSPIR